MALEPLSTAQAMGRQAFVGKGGRSRGSQSANYLSYASGAQLLGLFILPLELLPSFFQR